MDAFGCDYGCRTVGESITKYNISNDWCAEFEVYDVSAPIYCVQVASLQKRPSMMALKLRIVNDPDAEYAGCMICPEQKTIAFKIDHISDLLAALNPCICPGYDLGSRHDQAHVGLGSGHDPA